VGFNNDPMFGYQMQMPFSQQPQQQQSFSSFASNNVTVTKPPASPSSLSGSGYQVQSWQTLVAYNGQPFFFQDSAMSAKLPFVVNDMGDSLVIDVCIFGLTVSILKNQGNQLFIGLSPEDYSRAIQSFPLLNLKTSGGQAALLFQASSEVHSAHCSHIRVLVHSFLTVR